MSKRLIAAISYKGKYHVAYHYDNPISEWKPILDIRVFNTFDEADNTAKDLAMGKYPDWHSGTYVNMR